MKLTHAEWCARYGRMRGIAERISQMRFARALALAQSVGIPQLGNILGNAANDENLTGWCFRNPDRLRVAKAARHIEDSMWEGFRILDRWHNRVMA